MATFNSIQMADGYRKRPVEDHGKLRYQYFDTGVLTVAYAQNDQIELCKLPPGFKRVLPCLSRFTCTLFGAGRTLNIGHRAYMKRPSDNSDTNEAENASAFVAALDVSAALNAVAWSTVLKYDIYSLQENVIFATVLGGTMPIGARAQGLMAYLYE